jgi:hypothetical protein
MNKTEIQRMIKEELAETIIDNFSVPSDQVLKDITREIKAKTGIIIPVFTSSPATTYNHATVVYTSDMSKDIKTSFLSAMFNSLELIIECYNIRSIIGGYEFRIYGKYYTNDKPKLPVKVNIGTIIYKNSSEITSYWK